jgi:protocatechuate 3,4-dioxygenase, alpha subunit
MTAYRPSPGQTVGPFFGYAMPFAGGHELVNVSHPGAIRLHGNVFDGNGDPVPDALLEIWQPGPDGLPPRVGGSMRRGFEFTGFGRASADEDGHYEFVTLLPGAPPGRTPFVAVTVFARGLLNRLFTRAYLPAGEDASDPFLDTLPAERRATLIARRDEHGYRFDVRLQGAGETVFLTFPRHES